MNMDDGLWSQHCKLKTWLGKSGEASATLLLSMSNEVPAVSTVTALTTCVCSKPMLTESLENSVEYGETRLSSGWDLASPDSELI